MSGGAEELSDLDTDLRDARGAGQLPDAGDAGQQVPLGTKGPHHRLKLSVQFLDHHLEVVDVIQVQATHHRVVLGEPALQRARQIRNLGAHLALAR